MTYEYFCGACGHEWEAEQPISAAPLTTCPACKSESAKRQVSGGQGFILKGGGWYADGYGSAKSGASGAASSKTAAATESKTETKTETKTEAKPAAKPDTSSGGKTS
jgi:putative FmdB family regulatory protein